MSRLVPRIDVILAVGIDFKGADLVIIAPCYVRVVDLIEKSSVYRVQTHVDAPGIAKLRSAFRKGVRQLRLHLDAILDGGAKLVCGQFLTCLRDRRRVDFLGAAKQQPRKRKAKERPA